MRQGNERKEQKVVEREGRGRETRGEERRNRELGK